MTTENLRAEADMLERDAGGHISTTSALLRAAADRIDDLERSQLDVLAEIRLIVDPLSPGRMMQDELVAEIRRLKERA